MNVTVVEGDLLDQDVDVIVNAWNRNIIPWWLLLPQGVSGAIKKRGGTGPFKELRKHGAIPLGGAVLTSAGKLPFKGDCASVIDLSSESFIPPSMRFHRGRLLRTTTRFFLQPPNENSILNVVLRLTKLFSKIRPLVNDFPCYLPSSFRSKL